MLSSLNLLIVEFFRQLRMCASDRKTHIWVLIFPTLEYFDFPNHREAAVVRAHRKSGRAELVNILLQRDKKGLLTQTLLPVLRNC